METSTFVNNSDKGIGLSSTSHLIVLLNWYWDVKSMLSVLFTVFNVQVLATMFALWYSCDVTEWL